MRSKFINDYFDNLKLNDSQTPHEHLNKFKATSESREFTIFGECLLAEVSERINSDSSISKERLSLTIQNHIQWTVFHFAYPRPVFNDNQSRNWIASLVKNEDIVDKIHSNVTDEIDITQYFPPTEIVKTLLNSEHAKYCDRPWIISLDKEQYINIEADKVKEIYQNFNYPNIEQLKLDSILNLNINTTNKKIELYCPELNGDSVVSLENILSEQSDVYRRVCNFANIIFTKDTGFNKIDNTESHLLCTHYLRIPLVLSNNYTEVYVALNLSQTELQDCLPLCAAIIYITSTIIIKIIDSSVSRYVNLKSNVCDIFFSDFINLREMHPDHPDKCRKLLDLNVLNKLNPSLETFSDQEAFDKKEAEFLSSIKVLYYDDVARGIPYKYISSILEEANIRIEKSSFLEEDFVKLPYAPGIIFIVNLIDLINSLRVKQLIFDRNKKKITIKIKLEDAQRFRHAFFGNSTGNSVKALRRLYTCEYSYMLANYHRNNPSKSIHKTLARICKHELYDTTETHSSTIYKGVVDFRTSISKNYLFIFWDS
jgi:hypothetical protein